MLRGRNILCHVSRNHATNIHLPVLRFPKISRLRLLEFPIATAQRESFHRHSHVALKNVESTYQRKTPVQHVLERPDTYVGTVSRISKKTLILSSYDSVLKSNKESKQTMKSTNHKIEFKEVSYVPALYRIIDELLVNAVDNFHRPETGTNKLQVDIDLDDTHGINDGWIHVYNNGKSVPVTIHKKENIYVPELVFGHLLTGSNFDDKELKLTGGRNGYGAKLANIYSKAFIVEIYDSANKKHYIQKWSDNMSKCEAPVISQKSRGTDFIKISILPDYGRFNVSRLQDEPDFLGVLCRRVFDLAACNNGLNVLLNGHTVPVNNFQSYVGLIFKDIAMEDVDAEKNTPYIYKRINDSFEIAVGTSLQDTESTHFTFVNSIATTQGGTHLNTVTTQLSQKIIQYIEKNHRDLQIMVPFSHVKNQLSIFMNCLLENPTFDSQTKETLTSKYQQISSKLEIPDSFIKEIAKKTNIIDNIVNFSLYKQKKYAKYKASTKEKNISIPKLYDADYAGTSKSSECTLILTEGDSAKSLAIAGLSVIGRQYYGVFPLKGKLLNVRSASKDVIAKNEEYQNIKTILGLQNNVDYVGRDKRLRYGKVLLMCDQDYDGSHIKGLFINMIHYFWPSLIKTGFIEEFITPLIKATRIKGKKKDHHSDGFQDCITFYTMPEYEKWKKNIPKEEESHWRIKYYKGLGTSTSEEAREYFRALDKHRIQFIYSGKKDDTMIEKAFSKQDVNQRKTWLQDLKIGTHVDHNNTNLAYRDFISKELTLFWQYDNHRSIPSLIDGLKPSQRKVLFSCFKRKLFNQEMKVAQLAGYVSENSAYHHGEQSLHDTITNMAQSFVGSNNIPLLYPSGQFGTRLQGGKDAASARYIFTKLSPITRHIFLEADDPVLDYLSEDDMQIEPNFYIPIIPMILVNGSEGLGTGYSTFIPSFNPTEIIDNLMLLIQGKKKLNPMKPWIKGFKGITKTSSSSSRYITQGSVKITPNCIQITELPVGKWTEKYKQFLEEFCDSKNHSESQFLKPKRFRDFCTESDVHFEVILSREDMKELYNQIGENGELDEDTHKLIISELKLETSLPITNMTLFDEKNELRSYSNPLHILQEFFLIRLQFYNKRKEHILSRLKKDKQLLESKVKFLNLIVNGSLQITKRQKHEIIEDLVKFGIDQHDLAIEGEGGLSSATLQDGQKQPSYDYLLNIPLWQLTQENVNKMNQKLNEITNEYNTLLETNINDIWIHDLLELKKKLKSLGYH